MEDRIYFEKFLSEDDFKYYSMLVFNENVMSMNYGRVFTVEEAQYIYELMLKENKDYDELGYFKVFQKYNNKFIGYSSLIPKEDMTEVEIEYMILPEYWRMGYGSEIVVKLLDNIKKVKSIKKITANLDPNNIGSKKILINNGFTFCRSYENPDDSSPVEMFIKVIE